MTIKEQIKRIAEEQNTSVEDVAKTAIELLGYQPNKYYTVDELAELWNCSSKFVYGLCRSGKLKSFKAGKSWTISELNRINYERRASR